MNTTKKQHNMEIFITGIAYNIRPVECRRKGEKPCSHCFLGRKLREHGLLVDPRVCAAFAPPCLANKNGSGKSIYYVREKERLKPGRKRIRMNNPKKQGI